MVAPALNELGVDDVPPSTASASSHNADAVDAALVPLGHPALPRRIRHAREQC